MIGSRQPGMQIANKTAFRIRKNVCGLLMIKKASSQKNFTLVSLTLPMSTTHFSYPEKTKVSTLRKLVV